MKNGVIILIAAFLVLIPLFPNTAQASPSYVPGEILVRFKPGASTESIHRLHSKSGSSKKADLSLVDVQQIRIPEDLSVEEAVDLYEQDPNVLYAEPNYILRALRDPSDWDCNVNPANCDQQWGLHNTGQTINSIPSFNGASDADIDAREAWNITTGSPDPLVAVIIAVIDTGIDYTHPDLAANMWMGLGQNFAESSPSCGMYTPSDPIDDNGHGTHVAGIIGAVGDNGIGVIGVMWNVKLMALKVLDCNGSGPVTFVVAAINYAIQNGARIINASFGGPGSSQSLRDAIAAAGAVGIVFVAAAGNDGFNNDIFPIFPANHDLPNVISVAASDANDQRPVFSNFGQKTVDVAAPGHLILSTVPDPVTCTGDFDKIMCDSSGYLFASGTSMAAPHVSGVAGLLLTQNPSLTPAEVKAIISLTTDPKGSFKGSLATSGRLNARKALTHEAGSGLSGGGGGCGGLGFTDGGPTPPGTALGFVAVLFSPLLLLLIRKWRLQKAQARFRQRPWTGRLWLLLVFLMLAALKTEPVQAEELKSVLPFDLTHSIALKLGYHMYPDSDYFDTNAAFFEPEDFNGPSRELEYDYRWRDEASLSFTLGYYDGRSDADEICCAPVRFKTTYFLMTPKFHARAVSIDWYVGAGIGYYLFKRKQTGLVPDTLSTSLAGLHGLLGVQWALTERLSAFIEARYARAVVKSANAFDDRLEIGGANFAIGAAYHFSKLR